MTVSANSARNTRSLYSGSSVYLKSGHATHYLSKLPKNQSDSYMQPEAESLLEAMIVAADLVSEFVDKLSEEAYLASSLHRSAVERQLFIIGGALSQLSRVETRAFESIPNASRIVSLRNLLARDYAQIDDAGVWDIVQNDLQPTVAYVRRVLGQP